MLSQHQRAALRRAEARIQTAILLRDALADRGGTCRRLQADLQQQLTMVEVALGSIALAAPRTWQLVAPIRQQVMRVRQEMMR